MLASDVISGKPSWPDEGNHEVDGRYISPLWWDMRFGSFLGYVLSWQSGFSATLCRNQETAAWTAWIGFPQRVLTYTGPNPFQQVFIQNTY